MTEPCTDKGGRRPAPQPWGNRLRPLLRWVVDYLAILLAELLALILRRDLLPIADPYFSIEPVYLYIVVPTIFLGFLHTGQANLRIVPLWRMMQSVFWGIVYSLLTIIMLIYFGHVAEMVSRLFVLMTGAFAFVFVVAARYFTKQYLNRLPLFQKPVIFIGAGRTAELLVQTIERDASFGYRILGFIDDHPVSKELAERFPVLGGFADAERIVREMGVATVLITAPGLPSAAQVALVNRLQPYVRSVKFVPDLIGAPISNITVEGVAEAKLMLLQVRNNLASFHNRLFKRVFDIIVSLCGLVVILPVGLIIAIAIRLDSKGPVIFAHRRIGRGGKEFACYKFRSMIVDAETVLERYLAENPAARAEWEREYKLRHDPRITKVGAFLRRTSLDELPQFFNVLRGDMSLVGPRPIVRGEIAKYGDAFADFCLVPPGITGIWQVSGRSDTTYEERVGMDSWYVRNWSVWIDLVYLIKTVGVVLRGRGAY